MTNWIEDTVIFDNRVFQEIIYQFEEDKMMHYRPIKVDIKKINGKYTSLDIHTLRLAW